MRDITRFFYSHINSKESFFLFGPRGTGKSTLVRKVFSNSIWIDFLDPETERTYRIAPNTLHNVLKANFSISNHSNVVVIDEVQKVPEILSIVHSLIEKKKGWKFILIGSSARKLKRSSADLLAGRALNYNMHTFMAAELQEDFDLERSLKYGMLPLISSAKDDKAKSEKIHAYISLYLKEEIQMEGLVRNIDNFARFLEAISFSHSSILNLSNISRECGVKRKTVENYITILEDLLLAYKISVFSKRAKRELINNHKFYLFDAGIYNFLRPKGSLDKPEEISGAGLEGLVFQHLKTWNDYSDNKCQIYFWRTRSGVEVDFIVYGEDTFISLEVKNSKKIHSQDVKPLKYFLKDYPTAQALLLYRGDNKIMHDDILCMPVDKFLLNLVPNKAIL